jgi:hypothetical protein
MASTERKLLTLHPGRTRTTRMGGCGVVFGGVFVVAGLGIALAMSGRATASGEGDLSWLGYFAAAIFVAFGAFIAGGALVGMRRRNRLESLSLDRPDAPWLADWEWDPDTAEDENARSMTTTCATAAFLVVFLTPFNVLVFSDELSGGEALAAGLLVIIFDAIAAFALYASVVTIWRNVKFGRSRLELGACPFRLGGRLSARFVTTRPIDAGSLRCTLRCVEEHWTETIDARGKRHPKQESYQIYEDSAATPLAGGREAAIAFDLPEAAHYATALSAAPPRYWELEVTADTPGLDFHAMFLVPVYGRDASAPDSRDSRMVS